MRLRCRRGGQGEAEGGDAEGVLAARRVDVLAVAHQPEPACIRSGGAGSATAE